MLKHYLTLCLEPKMFSLDQSEILNLSVDIFIPAMKVHIGILCTPLFRYFRLIML